MWCLRFIPLFCWSRDEEFVAGTIVCAQQSCSSLGYGFPRWLRRHHSQSMILPDGTGSCPHRYVTPSNFCHCLGEQLATILLSGCLIAVRYPQKKCFVIKYLIYLILTFAFLTVAINYLQLYFLQPTYFLNLLYTLTILIYI